MMPASSLRLNGSSRLLPRLSSFRRLWLSMLPKAALSWVTGLLTDIPLPRAVRPWAYRRFANRYGANLAEMAGELRDYGSLAAFFSRPLLPGARPIAATPLVWPCDGRIVSSGPLRDGRIEQIKGQDYEIEHLVLDGPLAKRLRTGSQATIYLAPGDYHRVHMPFDGQRLRNWHVSGSLFPVNPKAVGAVPQLFVRNERMVFECRLEDGRAAAVVMVAALNVGSIKPSFPTSGPARRGDELGVFGFGSTVVVVVERGGPAFPVVARETAVRMGGAVPEADPA